ncbi:MAG: 16S rRNA (guanine(527)-N(7))-methyltransferase RsmG [Polyangiaceae bacterium]
MLAPLAEYLGRLLATNERMNLTAVTEPKEAWVRHVADALSLLPHLGGLDASSRVADVGSGGGVPGIPLAIARPELQFTLIEATQKKATFLREAVADLGLTNVDVLPERAESLAKLPLHRGRYNVVIARAVAKIAELVDWTAPLVAPGGRELFIKGERAPDELAAAKKTLARHHLLHRGTTQTATGRVVVLERASQSPSITR